MGVFTIKAKFYNPRGPQGPIVEEVWVDTGATYSGLASSTLRNLGIEPEGRREATLADGRIVARDYAIIGLEIEGERGLVPVTFKEEGSPGIIGATALELLGFWVDPVEKRLIRRLPIVR